MTDAPPQIHFRTLNGFLFWRASPRPRPEETASPSVRRAFEIETPSGALCWCAVELTASVRSLVRQRMGREPPREHPVWDLLCRSALSDYLCERGALPPGNRLVFGYSRDQLEMVATLHPAILTQS